MKPVLALALAIVWLPATYGGEFCGIRKETKRLQGAWRAVSIANNGRRLPKDEAKKIRLLVKGNRFIFESGTTRSATTVYLYPASKPRALDLWVERDMMHLGIYSLKGNKFKLCLELRPSPRQRPRDFAAKPAQIVYTFRREMP
jgi:uncharacterized protein (TIGR03067 family)